MVTSIYGVSFLDPEGGSDPVTYIKCQMVAQSPAQWQNISAATLAVCCNIISCCSYMHVYYFGLLFDPNIIQIERSVQSCL